VNTDTGLFDIVALRIPPFRHYVAHGDPDAQNEPEVDAILRFSRIDLQIDLWE
jgi:hypothetical protein